MILQAQEVDFAPEHHDSSQRNNSNLHHNLTTDYFLVSSAVSPPCALITPWRHRTSLQHKPKIDCHQDYYYRKRASGSMGKIESQINWMEYLH